MSYVNFDVCLIAFVMYLLNGVPFSMFALIRDYYTPLSLGGFPNATTLLSLSFKFFFFFLWQNFNLSFCENTNSLFYVLSIN